MKKDDDVNEALYRGRYVAYILTVNMGAFTLAYQRTVYQYLSDSKSETEYMMYLRPVLMLLGATIGGAAMRYGRRLMLILGAVVICILALPFVFFTTPWVCDAVSGGVDICFSFTFVAIVLYSKETSSFERSGVPLAYFFAFFKLGYATEAYIEYMVGTVNNIDINEGTHPYLRCFVACIGLLPMLAQLLLLLCCYTKEPPMYLVTISSEEEALVMLKYFYRSQTAIEKTYQHMRWLADSNKFAAVSWTGLCRGQHCVDLVLCFLLVFARSCTGYYSYELMDNILAPNQQALYDWITEVCYCICTFITVIYVDKLSMLVLLRLGYALVILFDIVCFTMMWLHVSYPHLLLPTTIATAITGLPYHLMIVPPTFKFVAGLLNDKGIVCALMGYVIGFMAIEYPLAIVVVSHPIWGTVFLQLGYLICAVFAFLFVGWYVARLSPRFDTKPDKDRV